MNKKPILLQINVVANWGSTGRIAEEIGQMAINNGWDSYIAYGREKNTTSHSNLIKIGSKWDMIMHGIQSRFFDNHGLASKKATKNLIKQIEAIQPNIIHLHNLHGYYLNYPLLMEYLSKTDIPVVWTLHDCWPFTGHCSYFSFENCNKWKTICNNCTQKNCYPNSYIFDNSKNNYLKKKKTFTSLKNLTIVPVSNWLGNILQESFFYSYPIKVIHNGIDLNLFNPLNDYNTYISNNKTFTILGVASIWEKRKGLNDFIELSKYLPPKYEIIIIGVTKEQITQLPNNIIGMERTNNIQELTEYYNKADVFLNPTYEDNFPTTNLEALACGTPVITYRTGGSPEAIDEQTGFVIEQGDIDGVINAIKQIEKKGKASFITACRERAVKYFNKKECYYKYLNLYNELIIK